MSTEFALREPTRLAAPPSALAADAGTNPPANIAPPSRGPALTPLAPDATLDAGRTAGWPSAASALTPPPWPLRGSHAKRRVFVDAGHGAPGNSGTVSVTCDVEQDYTLKAAEELAARLTASGAFEVKLSRTAGASPSYQARLDAAAAWKADVLLSLHMDARGEGVLVNRTAEGRECFRSEGALGFSVLWSDEAAAPLAAGRHRLASALAARLVQTGFPAYDGADYPGLYENDAAQPGVFLDRHEAGRRVWFLRKSALPGVIIETHHSWHPEEHARWQEARTYDAFAAAVAAALADFFAAPAPSGR
jgi:N-acetylmuramoyl-L-alanine amidase